MTVVLPMGNSLYVAVSRIGSPSEVKFAIRQTHGAPETATRNVVFTEVFKKIFKE